MVLLDANLPGEFFTVESMATLTGAILVTGVITNVLQKLTKWDPKWIGFVTAMIISIAYVFFSENAEAVNYFMAFINGFLIYASAVGGMQILGTSIEQLDPTIHSRKHSRKFFNKWY